MSLRRDIFLYKTHSDFFNSKDIGEVWANILHNVYAALVGAHGWSATARTDPTTSEGNVVFMHLFIDSLPLQPCNPTCKHKFPTASAIPSHTLLISSLDRPQCLDPG